MIGHDHSHHRADTSADGIRALKVSLVVLVLVGAAQAVVVGMTGSVALLADTIHNVSDALTSLPLWVAFAVGRRSATRRYTYGFGRAEDLAGIFIVAMIGLSAVVAGVESVRRLLDPQPLEHAGAVVAAGLLGFAGNELVAGYRIRAGRRIGSAALVADGRHARADGFTSLAVVVGALGALAGLTRADAVVGLLITVAIAAVLAGAAKDVYGRLMDAVDPSLVDVAEDVIRAVPGVTGHDPVRIRWVGHQLRGEVAVSADGSLDLAAADRIAARVHHDLRHAIDRLEHVSVRVGAADMVESERE